MIKRKVMSMCPSTGYCNGWNDAVEEFNSVNGIPVIYNSLYKLKAKYPSFRFGQIFQLYNEYLEKYNSDPYYTSDEEYVKEFERFVDKLTESSGNLVYVKEFEKFVDKPTE